MLPLSVFIRSSLIPLIVFSYAVNGIGISSKLNFDDSDSESTPLENTRNFQTRFKTQKSINDPFADRKIKINNDHITDINCDSPDTLCEITVKPLKKVNGADQVVTKVNIQVETKLKKDEEENKRKNITISDVPIYRGKIDSVTHRYNHKIPISSTNVPFVRGQSTPSRPLSPKPVFIPLTNPTYSTVTFDENFLPNSMWITRNLNTDPNVYYRTLITNNNPNLNQWFYPTSELNSKIPKATNDLNKYYNDVRLYLENSLHKANYPGNVQIQHRNDETNPNQATDNFYKTLESSNSRQKVKKVDGKLAELDS